MSYSLNKKSVTILALFLIAVVFFSAVMQPFALENEESVIAEKTEQTVDITDKQKFESYKSEHAQKDIISSNQIIIRAEQGGSLQEILNGLSENVRNSIDIQTARKLDARGIYVINTLGDGKEAVLEELNETTGIVYAQPNFKLMTSSISANENNWGLYNEGQPVEGVNGVAGIDVNISEAWDETRGSEEVVIGVWIRASTSTMKVLQAAPYQDGIL